MAEDYFTDCINVPNNVPGVEECDATKLPIATAFARFKKLFLSLFTFLLITTITFSQKEPIPGWHLLDAQKDGYHGISLQPAMHLLQGRQAKPIIVAVMDGGIDTAHKALRPNLWTNPKEVAGNGKDDDGNGYADDIHGWNFLGNAAGQNVNKESQEAVRIYHRLKGVFQNLSFDSVHADANTRELYMLWKRSNQLLEIKPEERSALNIIQLYIKANRYYDSLIQAEWGRTEYASTELETYVPKNSAVKKAKMGYLRFIELLELDPDKTNRQTFQDLDEYINQQKELQNAKQTPALNYRDSITGNDEDDFSSKSYGNSDIMGGTSLHGTHVSGIVAGIADTTFTGGVYPRARIMMVRCVPNGDEHDKDVALGIRYAVDNGAKIINMSFGKALSPHKAWVDDALRYAGKHDVLIIRASGNDSKNTDTDPDYPSAIFNNNEKALNVISVGASGDSSLSGGIVAGFTNYGAKTVDVLAPGVKIFSCMPYNKYGNEQGTSMSAPVVAGIAALLRSYFPKLTAVQVKQIIEESSDQSMANKRFRKPGGDKKETLTLKQICKTGGIANAYSAVQMALKTMNN
jgi:cell wall-associated protease